MFVKWRTIGEQGRRNGFREIKTCTDSLGGILIEICDCLFKSQSNLYAKIIFCWCGEFLNRGFSFY